MKSTSARPEELVARFEDRTLAPAGFRHREHLCVAWSYLRAHPFEEAAYRFIRGLRAYVEEHGVADKFHATVTWSYLALLAELLDDPDVRAMPFDVFLSAHPELLDTRSGPLAQLYAYGTLTSDRARRLFVLPDRPRTKEGRRSGAPSEPFAKGAGSYTP